MGLSLPDALRFVGADQGRFLPMNDAPVAPLVTTRHDEDVAVIEFDDGKHRVRRRKSQRPRP